MPHQRDRKYRKYQQGDPHSYSFGTFPTLELLSHRPEQARQVVAHRKGLASEGVKRIEARCRELGVPFDVDDRLVAQLSHKGNIYVFAVFEKFAAPLEARADHLLLVNPSDMGNLGTIARTMLGFAMRDLALITPAADPFNPHVVRASVGSVFALRIEAFESLEAYRALHGHRLYPFMMGGEHRLDEIAFASPYTLVFGSEGAGLPERYREVGVSVAIPQSPLVESLNLAVAVGIALYAAKGKEVP